jgi:hypothetical protein
MQRSAWAQKARNPAAYLAERIEDSSGGDRRRAEDRFALEILADELGIKDEVLKAIAVRRHESSR